MSEINKSNQITIKQPSTSKTVSAISIIKAHEGKQRMKDTSNEYIFNKKDIKQNDIKQINLQSGTEKKWKDLYVDDFSEVDFPKAKWMRPGLLVLKAITPEETQSHKVLTATNHNNMTSVVFRVVHKSADVPEHFAVGDIVSVNIAAIDALSEQAKFAVCSFEDVYMTWLEEDLKI